LTNRSLREPKIFTSALLTFSNAIVFSCHP
jgi:hypothetical protein